MGILRLRVLKFAIMDFEYFFSNGKKWADYTDDEPLPQLPWINYNQPSDKDNVNDHEWITVTKKKR